MAFGRCWYISPFGKIALQDSQNACDILVHISHFGNYDKIHIQGVLTSFGLELSKKSQNIRKIRETLFREQISLQFDEFKKFRGDLRFSLKLVWTPCSVRN